MKIFSFIDKPGKPSIPKPTDVTKRTAKLSWKAPKSDGGAPITNYKLEYRMLGAFRWTPVKEDISGTTFIVYGLEEDSEYEFRVAAVNKAGQGQFAISDESVRTTEPVGMYHLCLF